MEKYYSAGAVVLIIALVIYGLLHVIPGKSKVEEIWPRLFGWVLISTLLFAGLYFTSPQQGEVAYYKFALVIGSAILGYWIDRCLFPYARPDGFLKDFWTKGTSEPIGDVDHQVVPGYDRLYALVMIRRAIIVGCTILGVTLGL